jgi:hypothetical protein
MKEPVDKDFKRFGRMNVGKKKLYIVGSIAAQLLTVFFITLMIAMFFIGKKYTSLLITLEKELIGGMKSFPEMIAIGETVYSRIASYYLLLHLWGVFMGGSILLGFFVSDFKNTINSINQRWLIIYSFLWFVLLLLGLVFFFGGFVSIIEDLLLFTSVTSIRSGQFPGLERIEAILIRNGISPSSLKVHLCLPFKEILVSFLIASLSLAILSYLLYLFYWFSTGKQHCSFKEFLLYGCTASCLDKKKQT